jgi:hypothetical protein
MHHPKDGLTRVLAVHHGGHAIEAVAHQAFSHHAVLQPVGHVLVEYDEFYPRKAKGEIDEVDTVLGPIVGLTDEQVDFVCNFDVKFRAVAETVGE